MQSRRRSLPFARRAMSALTGTLRAQPADHHHRRNRHRARQPRRCRDRRLHPDAAARRHRPEPRGQDHLHHRAGPQPPDRRPARGLRADGRWPLHRRAAGGIPRRRDPALRLRAAPRGADRQDAALAGVDAPHLAAAADAEVPVAELARRHRRSLDCSTSTSSTIPASGCSTCRCSARPSPSGAPRRSSAPGGRSRPTNAAPLPRRPRQRPTSSATPTTWRPSDWPRPSPTTSAPAAPTATRSRRCRPAASSSPAISKARRR